MGIDPNSKHIQAFMYVSGYQQEWEDQIKNEGPRVVTILDAQGQLTP